MGHRYVDRDQRHSRSLFIGTESLQDLPALLQNRDGVWFHVRLRRFPEMKLGSVRSWLSSLKLSAE